MTSKQAILRTKNKRRDVPHLALVRPPIPGATPTWYCVMGDKAFPGKDKESAYDNAIKFKEEEEKNK